MGKPLLDSRLLEPKTLPNRKPIHQKPVLFRLPRMDKVYMQPDVTYRRIGDTELKMDIYNPSQPSKAPVPGVVFVHGGPLEEDYRPRLKDWEVFRSYGRLVAAAGMVGVTFNHRFHGFSQLEQSTEDVETAVSYLRGRAHDFGLNPNRLGFWVFSRGGPHLSFLLRERPAFCRCIVAYYALLDLRADPAFSSLHDETIRRFSPALYMNADDPLGIPILIARAGLDRPEYNHSIDSFVRRALAANASLDFANHPGGHHAFDILDDSPLTRRILRRTIEFVGACLRDEGSTVIHGGTV